MRKMFGWLLVFVFLAGLAGTGFAQVEEKKAELEKIKQYIITLDQKIIKARADKQINKIAELKELKRRELARAKELRQEIARLEKAEVRPRAAKRMGPKAKRGGFQVGAGYGGGAAILGAGYTIPTARLDLLIDAGYGLGNEYSVLSANISGVIPLGANYVGIGLGMANYSEKVKDIPGLSGEIDKGSRFGAGLFFGRCFGPLRAQLGYNSALGLTAGLNYKF
ncbi:hypothetical protein AMJ44_09475 [candidate division WOR-1 bacterium DG_54_3]|uniref:Outer membrane protein beta-barrel domain-containing protein n=1 Tax=candidate division WOR-1 bacterium DG_54_3 TaxID=1703775 RepID=A0A0S7XUF4_UNCSA|nr:MAG: hypothetical protein AMJ44_09475 [candidate division WOR-1 bacterium DG_54_3]